MSAGTTAARQTFAWQNMQIIHTYQLQTLLVTAAADGYNIVVVIVIVIVIWLDVGEFLLLLCVVGLTAAAD